MKTILLILIFSAYLIPGMFCQLYCQHDDELTDESSTYYKIYTPLCNQQDKEYKLFNFTWEPDEVEHCRQAWLKEGGLFKMSDECKFSEKNNYLDELKARCIAIDGDNIYIGTSNGIYLSTDYGEHWLAPDDDGINNLPGKGINSLAIGGGRIFAGTNQGIWVSTNNGESWARSLQNCNITCIEFGRQEHIYVGSDKVQNNGIFKSTDNGATWSYLSLNMPIYCLKYVDGTTFYAGVSDGFYKSTNEGGIWVRKWSSGGAITSIFADEDIIYSGTHKNGCFKSTDGGESFTDFSNNLPIISGNDYYTINSLQKFGDKLYCATENGLYKRGISSWSACNVKDSFFKRNIEYLTKLIYNDNDETLWVVCSESNSPKWPTAVMITDYPEPMNPTNFPKFNCHSFAWHLWEGGITGLVLDGPKDMKYIPSDATSEWDYIETTWNDPLWDKVMYGEQSHSGIKSPTMINMPENENDLIIDSKWGQNAPLVRHKLRDNPWGNLTIKYWKSKKVISGETTSNKFIGRQLITEESTEEFTTIIPNGENVEFYVAPMYEHKIHLKSGFHAVAGSEFHAYVKDKSKGGCEIPWESEPIIREVDMIVTANDNLNMFSSDEQSFNSVESPLLSTVKISSELDTSACLNRELFIEPFPGKGSGTKEDPYQITNIYEFSKIESIECKGEGYYILMNDIDASETKYWNPIIRKNGDTVYRGFWGLFMNYVRSLDGQGHIIRNLHMVSTGGGPAFLFTGVKCLEIKRIGFENLQIGPGSGLVGFQLISYNDTGFVMEECFFTGFVELNHQDGWNEYSLTSFGIGPTRNTNTIIKNCYVDLEVITDSLVYGFGRALESPYYKNMEARYQNCYTTTRTSAKHKVFSPFGYTGNVYSCFWDSDLYKPTEPLGKGTGLPTSEMKRKEPFEFAGWDFENVWYIDEGKDYPRLRAFKRDTTSVEEHSQDAVISLSPNPASDYIEINLGRWTPPSRWSPSGPDIKIYNALGECVMSESIQPMTSSHRMNIEHLSSGVYFVRLISGGQAVTKQFVVVK